MRYRNVTYALLLILVALVAAGPYTSGRRPGCHTGYQAHIHMRSCGEEEGGSQGHSNHECGTAMEIEYPLSPYKKGKLSNTTLMYKVTLEGLLSAEPKHANVHFPGSGNPPPVACANLNEAW